MALPDVTRLKGLPAEKWRALGQRLLGMGIEPICEEVIAIGGGLFDPAADPLRRWHLQREDTAVHRVVRVFCMNDPVPRAAADEVLGAATIDDLCAAGMLIVTDAGVVSPFRLRAFERLLYFADHLFHGGDAVMGAGPLTGALLRTAAPAVTSGTRLGRALDLGCGAGLVALVLARATERVIATDITERARTIAEINAMVNGAANIEFRTGDLFEPARGERFDLILSQPPFFPAPEELPGQAYSQGGRRGDELCLRLLSDVLAHLTPRGRATLIAEWPIVRDEPITDRVQKAIGPGANVLSIEADGPDVDSFCIGDTAFAHPGFGEDYARAVVAQRAHMRSLGIRTMRGAITVIEPAPAGADGWTATFPVRDLLDSGVDADLVQGRIRAHDLLSRDREALFAARLRLRGGLSLATTSDGFSRVLVDRGAPLVAEIRLDPTARRLLDMVDGLPTVGAAAKRYAKEANGPRTAATDRFAQAVTQSLAAGILDVVPAREGAA